MQSTASDDPLAVIRLSASDSQSFGLFTTSRSNRCLFERFAAHSASPIVLNASSRDGLAAAAAELHDFIVISFSSAREPSLPSDVKLKGSDELGAGPARSLSITASSKKASRFSLSGRRSKPEKSIFLYAACAIRLQRLTQRVMHVTVVKRHTIWYSMARMTPSLRSASRLSTCSR